MFATLETGWKLKSPYKYVIRNGLTWKHIAIAMIVSVYCFKTFGSTN
jgi:cystathionine beta-lyase family protein involved in aluminum resistance